MTVRSTRHIALTSVLLLAATALPFTACGGGSTGAADTGRGLVLLSFLQSGLDNVAINTRLEFRFSEAVDPGTVDNGSIQIRVGSEFGATAEGTFKVLGSTVYFEPVIPGECGYADSGLTPGTTFRVSVVGSPEENAVRNTQGQPLEITGKYEFETLPDTIDGFLVDQIPGALPTVVETTPAIGRPAAPVTLDDSIRIEFTENLDPCTIRDGQTVVFRVFELGDKDVSLPTPGGRPSGFNPVQDSEPGDPYTWGGNATALPSPQRIPTQLTLVQDFDETVLYVSPMSGRFPENCLLVLELTGGIRDFGGAPLPPYTLDFTTENVPETEVPFLIRYDDTTPIDVGGTTADVNTARSPSKAQAWISFGGDGDNGPSPDDIPSFPVIDAGSKAYQSCGYRPNDGTRDEFAPTMDTTLYTGSTVIPTTCLNESDGSSAVVFEFSRFQIPDNVTVTITGVNPAIILVNGDVDIAPLGTLSVQGSNGGNGATSCSTGGAAGKAGPGGGDGGVGGYQQGSPDAYGGAGVSGFGSGTAFESPGIGGGEGGVSAVDPPGWGGSGAGGGGGGHAVDGQAGQAQLSGTGQFMWADTPVKGGGGGAYPDSDDMREPVAGSGGGGGGCDIYDPSWSTSNCDTSGAMGGGGGGGAGFVGITADGDIRVFGTILAVGGRGGGGGNNTWTGGAGGGGGSGGGVRLLTPRTINLNGGTITTAGGLPGSGQSGSSTNTINLPHFANNGGAGSYGRIVLEDADGFIDGINTATLIPGTGSPAGFYTNKLDTTRFVSGGTSSVATTEPMGLGSILDVSAVELESLTADDFVAGIPAKAVLGAGGASMVVEMQGFLSTSDAEIDESSATGWYVVGFFSDSGVPGNPVWTPDLAPAGFTPDAGIGIWNLDGRTVFVQARITFSLSSAMGSDDPGPYVDDLRIRYKADN